MRKIIPIAVLVFYVLLTGFDIEPVWNGEYEPIFMYRAEMESSVILEESRFIKNPGKIYIKDDYIFINEKYLGIHVIDNTNPENPEFVNFIHIDGCIDMAINGNVLYADNAVDLISVKLNSDFTGIEVTSRIKNVFPELAAPDGRTLNYQEKMARPENSILVKWKHN